jgi:putative transcriptional regulator
LVDALRSLAYAFPFTPWLRGAVEIGGRVEKVGRMAGHENRGEGAGELVALHALGMLDAGDADALYAHLAECDACGEDFRAFQAVAADLAESVAVTPPPGARDRLLARIAGEAAAAPKETQVWKRWDADASSPLTTVRAGDGGWEETAIEGILVRRLFVDPVKQTATMMVRMAPGTSYPGHRHGGAEECLVLEGDLHVGDRVLYKGDFQRAELDSIHPVQSTEGGCVLFIVSSLGDELLA